MTEKYYNEQGEVAVLYSPGFGAGWSTWSFYYREELVFDKRIVEKVLARERELINEEFMQSLGYTEYTCLLGADELTIAWLPVDTRFTIEEYGGAESLRTEKSLEYTA